MNVKVLRLLVQYNCLRNYLGGLGTCNCFFYKSGLVTATPRLINRALPQIIFPLKAVQSYICTLLTHQFLHLAIYYSQFDSSIMLDTSYGVLGKVFQKRPNDRCDNLWVDTIVLQLNDHAWSIGRNHRDHCVYVLKVI